MVADDSEVEAELAWAESRPKSMAKLLARRENRRVALLDGAAPAPAAAAAASAVTATPARPRPPATRSWA